MSDAAGNSSVASLTITQSSLTLTINDLSGVDLHQPHIDVTGTINSSDYKVWVNGVEALLDAYGNWSVSGVPVNEGGTAVIQARAIPLSDNGGNLRKPGESNLSLCPRYRGRSGQTHAGVARSTFTAGYAEHSYAY
jgi:hypothetical protein